MHSLIRVSCVSNRVRPLQPEASLGYLLEGVAAARKSEPDLIVLPAFAFTGSCCGSLYGNRALLEGTRAALDELRLATANFPGYVVAGLVIDDWNRPAPVCAVLRGGELLGLTPAAGESALAFEGGYSSQVLPAGTVFAVGNCRFTVFSCPPEELLLHTAELAATGCDLVVCPTAQPVCAGSTGETRRVFRQLTKTLGCAAALCNGGTGDSTSARLFQGFVGLYECGEELCFIAHKNAERDSWGDFLCADIDTDIIAACKRGGAYVAPYARAQDNAGKRGIQRRISANPFLCQTNRDAYLGELFAMQVCALTGRLTNTGIKRMVLGVSGGLDSTLALLVAARAADDLGLPRSAILAVTMPGFGTSGRTYHNAVELMERLDCDMAEISVKDSCLLHFKDIGHDPEVHDVTYENAQARERTQILFDLANRVGGLVLGTGDLSEEALGWCTFGGDHLAGYNVNVCLTKNMIRAVVKYVAGGGVLQEPGVGQPLSGPDARELGLKRPKSQLPPASMTGKAPELGGAGVAAVLADILATPVSPELLPAKNGKIAQKTEEILGTYDVHDFFLYYFVKYHFAPTKLFRYACVAFGAQVPPAQIKELLLVFLRRFFAAQFKRSCAPDAAAITEVNLLPEHFTMPSDASAAAFLAQAEQISLSEST